MSRNKVPRRFAKHGPPGDTQLIWRKGAEKSSEKVPVPTFVHALSADRFDTYLKWAGADQTLAERLYTYNVQHSAALYGPLQDRKSVVWGKSVSERVDLGGRRSIKKRN